MIFLIIYIYTHMQMCTQNCFALDVVKSKNRGNLAELLRFGCLQVQTLEVSQNYCVFKLAHRQIDRQMAR